MNRWQTIVWTKDSLVYRHIQMFQGIIELMPINPFNFLTYLNSSLCFLCPNITFNSSPPSAAYMRHYWVSIGSSNGLLSVQPQAITWTNAGLLSIGHLGTNFSEIQIEIQKFSFMKMHFKKCCLWQWRPFSPGGDWLTPGMDADQTWALMEGVIEGVKRILKETVSI